nr:MAG: internal scaffolding protein [Microviridae sp.]
MSVRIQSLYDRDPFPGLGGFEPSPTNQHFAEEMDINAIMERASRGVMPDVSGRSPIFGDFSGVSDYADALRRVEAAQDDFMELPVSVRSRFENDPGLLLAFLDDPRNRAEAVSLGLIVEPPAAPVVPVAPVAPVVPGTPVSTVAA